MWPPNHNSNLDPNIECHPILFAIDDITGGSPCWHLEGVGIDCESDQCDNQHGTECLTEGGATEVDCTGVVPPENCDGLTGLALELCRQQRKCGDRGDGETVNDCTVAYFKNVIYDIDGNPIDGTPTTVDDPDATHVRICARAERAGNRPEGRHYGLSVHLRDSCDNNITEYWGEIYVPHDRSDKTPCVFQGHFEILQFDGHQWHHPEE